MKSPDPSQKNSNSLTQIEIRHRTLIGTAVARRLELVVREREATEEISRLCREAVNEGIKMGQLAEWVQVLDPDGKPRSVTRQAVDLMLAKIDGRHRASFSPRPRRPREQAESNGGEKKSPVNLSAFE